MGLVELPSGRISDAFKRFRRVWTFRSKGAKLNLFSFTDYEGETKHGS